MALLPRPGRPFPIAVLTVVAALLTSCGSPAPAPAPSPFPENAPRLMLFLVVDQLSQEYLVRFRPLLGGGLAYLLEHGVVFADAHHDHANTVTGAGHATLSTGCFPRRSGIISNQWRDRATGRQVYCVQDEQYRRSPANLLVSTIGDWLKDMDPTSKVFAASGKDRSAILLGGHQADAALWYDGGDWVTTGYYETPTWLEDFNDAKWLDQYFGTMWEPLPVPQETLDELDIVMLDEGIYQRNFPYAFGGKSLIPDGSFYNSILSSPFSDRYLMELARSIITEEDLGADEHPDLLAISFHALDYVGHGFGPNSREVLDTVLRLDRTMGELFDFIDQQIGLDNVVISLSADHGVAPIPAYRRSVGEWAERADLDDVACFQNVGRALRQRYGNYDWVRAGLYLDDDAIEEAGIDRSEIERQVATLLGQCDSVERVWTWSELLETPPAASSTDEASRYRQLFANSFHPDRSPDFELQYTAYYLRQMSRGTSHGTPHTYDTWVPFIVLAPGLRAHEVGDRVRTADLAPTLAGIMGIEAPADLDGVDRRAWLQDW